MDVHRPTIEGTRGGDALLGPSLHLKELNSVSLLREEFLPQAIQSATHSLKRKTVSQETLQITRTSRRIRLA